MRSVSLPPWGVALAVAATAPFVVKLFGESLQKRKRRATEAFLALVRTENEGKLGPQSDLPREEPTEAHVAEASDLGEREVRRTSWHD